MSERLTGAYRRLLPGAGGRARLGLRLGAVLLALALLYYPVGMLLIHNIDDDVAFAAAGEDAVPGGSQAVAIATALLERELRQKRWVANDPWFLPSAPLDNMPNFQQGIVRALGRFAFELTDQIGRTRGSSRTDADLQEASGQLQYAGDIWIFDFSTSLAPTTTSESRYLKARASLLSYNRRVAREAAVFERRADNLLATLDRFALDLGASSAALDQRVQEGSGALLDLDADDLFYGVKGQTYAYYLLLRELGRDYEGVIAERELGPAWSNMLESMQSACELSPWVVVNGAPDSAVLPSHLAAQGFYLLRARTKLREITNILLK